MAVGSFLFLKEQIEDIIIIIIIERERESMREFIRNDRGTWQHLSNQNIISNVCVRALSLSPLALLRAALCCPHVWVTSRSGGTDLWDATTPAFAHILEVWRASLWCGRYSSILACNICTPCPHFALFFLVATSPILPSYLESESSSIP